MEHLGQCSNCPTVYYVDLEQLARGISRVACPVCATITDFADKQRANPNVTPEASNGWALVSALGIIAGLFVAANLADRALSRLTA